MLKKQTINKLNKSHEEALGNLTNKQVTLLMQKVTEDFLKELFKEDFNNEKASKLLNFTKYFTEQDIYTAYNSLHGMFQSTMQFAVQDICNAYSSLYDKLESTDIKRMSLSVELETYKLNDFIQMNNTAINKFNTNFKNLKYFLSKIYKYSNNPEIVKELNELIGELYINTKLAKAEAEVEDCIVIIANHKEEIEKRNKNIKELITEYDEIVFDDSIIKELELNLKLLFDSLEEYYKNLEEFETMSEDGFIFLKEKEDATNSKLNLIYDFTEFDIKEAVKNES